MGRHRSDGADALRYAFAAFQHRQREAVRAAVEQVAEEVNAQARSGFHPSSILPYRVEATMDGRPLRGATLYGPEHGPSRRRSAPLSRYDRLAPALPDDSL